MASERSWSALRYRPIKPIGICISNHSNANGGWREERSTRTPETWPSGRRLVPGHKNHRTCGRRPEHRFAESASEQDVPAFSGVAHLMMKFEHAVPHFA